ncbi:hypothetical protein AB833_17570 [Chromatiales bacterium (ex Bugula neritina AB1)]|nr:hypothetical protein AB833_17570 [Chromatiales bacterium (ex Bugula neritina AB1)]
MVLHQCWNEGSVVDYQHSDLWPDTPEQGYAIQSLVAALRKESVKGWKIAATAVAGRHHINVDRPLAGRLYESICHPDGAQLPFGRNRMAVAEAEFVFTLGKDLPSREAPYTDDEVADSISSLHAGLEFPDSRFSDFRRPGTAGLIADNACAANFVLGESTEQPFDPQQLAEHETALYINGEPVTTGRGGDALDGPLNALVWIANTLSGLGTGLVKGQFVTTGVTGLPSPVKAGDTIRADLGKYGSASAMLL